MRVSKDQRRVILAEFERSGLSAVGFVRKTGLKYSTFANWVARHRGVKRPERKTPLRLLEAVVSPSAGPVLPVHLPGGARLELSDVNQVALAAALVRALEKPC